MFLKIAKFVLFILALYILYKIILSYLNKKPNKKKNVMNKKFYSIITNPNNYSSKDILELGFIFQKVSDIDKAIQLYEIAHNKGNKDSCVYLGDIYYEYTNDSQKALNYYYEAIYNNYYGCLLSVGDIYIYGCNNVPENKKLAYKCYNTIVNLGIPVLTDIAHNRMNSLNSENENFLNSFTPFIENYFIKKEDKSNLDKLITSLANTNIMQGPTKKVKNKKYNMRIKNDRQNVHDHVVSNSISNSIHKLQNNTKIIKDLSQSLREIREYIINSKNPETEKKDAIKTLDYMERYNTKLTTYKKSELDLLNIVWNRIHSPENKSRMEILKKNLFNELIECNELNTFTKKKELVCSTGRFSRILDTLNCADSKNLVRIVPKFILNKEMMEKASSIRKKLVDDQSISTKKALNSIEDLNNEQEILVDNFHAVLKKELLNKFYDDYVKSGLMTKKILDNEINKWIDLI